MSDKTDTAPLSLTLQQINDIIGRSHKKIKVVFVYLSIYSSLVYQYDVSGICEV